jgi:hypothetical protein
MLIMKPTETWEMAWERYIDALTDWERSYPDRFKRGNIRRHKQIAREYQRAKSRLIAIDAEFCARLDIIM